MEKRLFLNILIVILVAVGLTATLSYTTVQSYFGNHDIVLGFSLILFFVFSVVVSLVVASIIAYKYVKRITEPLNILKKSTYEISMGIYDNPIKVNADRDIQDLAVNLEKMRKTISKTLQTLENKNNQLDAIVNTMAGGLIALDKNGSIMMINKNSVDLLEIMGKHNEGRKIEHVVRNDEFNAFIKNTEEITNIKIGSKHLRLNKSYIETGGLVILINDVTKVIELAQMRSEFVSNVTHELKTPLTSIMGFTDTLKNGAIENKEVALRFLNIIDIESTRLLNLINDILELSHIETMKKPEDNEDFNLDEVINKVIELVSQNANSKNVTLNYTNTGVVIFANKDKIKEVVINLVSNAIKYNVDGGIVDIKVSKDDKNIYINVKDTGIGIAQEHLPRLFERFYRVDQGRSRQLGGTGLGLSIVKHIVSLYEGNVTVNSVLGQGSEFKVTIPVLGGKNNVEK